MKNNLFFIVLCFSLFWVPSIFAADVVPLRVSEKGDYDRIVFGWENAIDYTIKNKDGLLTVKFSTPAEVKGNIKAADNIGSYEVLSKNPLEVRFQIPKSSKVRDFKIGKRVVLDVYSPTDPNDKLPQPKPPKEPQKKEDNKKPVVKQTKVAPSKAQEKAPEKVSKTKEESKLAEAKKTITEKKQPPASPPAFVLVPEKLAPKKSEEDELGAKQKEEENKKKKQQRAALKRAVKQENHVIAIRSTTNLGVSAFLLYDDMWIVLDNNASLVAPSLNTSTPELFGNFQRLNIEDASAYRISMPQDEILKIQAQGVGLTWDLIIGDKVKPKVAPQPIYKSNSAVLFPLYGVSKILNAQHPETGEPIIIVTAEEARQFGVYKQSFVEFEMLHSPIGLAILPKVDDLTVTKTARGILVTRPQGLALASSSDRKAAQIFQNQSADQKQGSESKVEQGTKTEDTNLYKFSKWKLGSAKDLTKNQNILLEAFPDKSEGRRVEDLITLGKMMLSHGLAAEALGYFEFAVSELPGLAESAEFKALRGAALALDWKSEDALQDLLHKSVKDEQEVKLWAAYVLADLGDWQQAASIVPSDYKPIYDYPNDIAHKLALTLAEVNLRAGKVNKAKELLTLVETTDQNISSPHRAALKYLKGEASRQEGNIENTKEIWEKLIDDEDDLFSVRAKLALTILESNKDKITTNEVIDRLESIRYAWRGDDLEAQIKYWLGKAYFDKEDFIVGLSIMRDAASIAGQTALARKIASDMAETYISLYLGPKLKKIKALEALAVYEQFRELTPLGAQGNKLEQNLAEHLVKAQLFERATKMLRHQVDHRLGGEQKLNVAIRLAEIELMDDNPQKAVNALSKASSEINRIQDASAKKAKQNEIELLRIRAYAQNKEHDKSLDLLEKLIPNQIVNRMKADIAWKAGYWDESAKHLNSVIIDENIKPDSKLDQEQTDLILNRAIALNLSNQQIALANIRAKYTSLMEPTNKANQFELITRPRRIVSADDREALLATVSEVEIFKNFLESYKQN